MGSPFVARVCELFSERLQPDGAVAAKLLGWPGDGGFSGALPLRVVGALHALVLEGRRLRFEPDGESPGGAVTLTVWPSGEERCVARADFHGRWIDWAGW